MTIADVGSEDFEEWLEGMQPGIEGFRAFAMPADWSGDYSLASVVELEAYLLERWPSASAINVAADEAFFDGATRYLGEALLRACGGGWQADRDPSSVFFGQPCVLLETARGVPIAPYLLFIAALERRTGHVLSKVYEAQVRQLKPLLGQHGPGWRPFRQPVPGITEGTWGEAELTRRGTGWFEQVPLRISSLKSLMSKEEAIWLDFSLTSLTVLEPTVLAGLTAESTSPEASDLLHESVEAYLGEVARAAAGGVWKLRSGRADPDNPYVGHPWVERTGADGNRRAFLPWRSVELLIDGSATMSSVQAVIENSYVA